MIQDALISTFLLPAIGLVLALVLYCCYLFDRAQRATLKAPLSLRGERIPEVVKFERVVSFALMAIGVILIIAIATMLVLVLGECPEATTLYAPVK